MGVESPEALFVPTTTVNRVPVIVTCWLTLLEARQTPTTDYLRHHRRNLD